MRRFSNLLVTVLICHAFAAAQVNVNTKVAGQYEVEAGLRAGAEIEIHLRDKISIVPGVYWTQRKHSETLIYNKYTMEYNDRADFITVPLLLSIRLSDWGKNVEPRLHVGPYAAYGVGGHSQWTRFIDGTVATGCVSAFDPEYGCWNKRFDAGLHIGLDMYIARHLVVGAYTELGFVHSRHSHNVVSEIVSNAFFGGMANSNYSLGISLGFRL